MANGKLDDHCVYSPNVFLKADFHFHARYHTFHDTDQIDTYKFGQKNAVFNCFYIVILALPAKMHKYVSKPIHKR